MSRPANVATGKCRDRQMSRSAKVRPAKVRPARCQSADVAQSNFPAKKFKTSKPVLSYAIVVLNKKMSTIKLTGNNVDHLSANGLGDSEPISNIDEMTTRLETIEQQTRDLQDRCNRLQKLITELYTSQGLSRLANQLPDVDE